jgi:hypothetical protein
MRIDPPPSPPVARLTSPPATAADDPADDPPTVRPCRHGLWVTPWSLVTLTLRPPNSEAVVDPTGTAPPRVRSRSTWWDVVVATRSLWTRDASVQGHPATGSSSLIAVGTPPKGSDTSACSTAACARSGSRWAKALRSDASMAASVASSSSRGERSPARKASTSEQASPCQVSGAVWSGMADIMVRIAAGVRSLAVA